MTVSIYQYEHQGMPLWSVMITRVLTGSDLDDPLQPPVATDVKDFYTHEAAFQYAIGRMKGQEEYIRSILNAKRQRDMN